MEGRGARVAHRQGERLRRAVFFPFLVIALLAAIVRRGRHGLPIGRFAFVAVALWFAAAKTIPTAHQATVWLASQLLGDVAVVRDPTDVVALLALVPAWRLYRRAAASAWPVSRVLLAPILCVAVLLTAGTSRRVDPGVSALIERDGALLAASTRPDLEGDNVAAFATRDGRRWEALPLGLPRQVVERHQARLWLELGGGERLELRGRELVLARRGRRGRWCGASRRGGTSS